MDVIIKFLKALYYSANPEICMDVAAWARTRGLPIIELHPALLPELEKYADQDPVAKKEITTHREALERAQTLVPIEDAIIRDGDGLVELPGGQICYEGNWWIGYLKNDPSYKRRFSLRKRYLKGDFFRCSRVGAAHIITGFTMFCRDCTRL
jgi:hypothetical protein